MRWDHIRKVVKTLEKPANNIKIKSTGKSIVDTSGAHVRELEDELLELRIENAFFKKLRRLWLEDEAKMRKRLESSAVSEDDSN